MVARITRSALMSAAEAGLGRIRHGCVTVWHGTRNTVPSRTFAEVSLGGHCGHRPNVRVARWARDTAATAKARSWSARTGVGPLPSSSTTTAASGWT